MRLSIPKLKKTRRTKMSSEISRHSYSESLQALKEYLMLIPPSTSFNPANLLDNPAKWLAFRSTGAALNNPTGSISNIDLILAGQVQDYIYHDRILAMTNPIAIFVGDLQWCMSYGGFDQSEFLTLCLGQPANYQVWKWPTGGAAPVLLNYRGVIFDSLQGVGFDFNNTPPFAQGAGWVFVIDTAP